MSHLAVFALGPLRIEIDGHPVQTSRHKALALLVYLALHIEKQSRETLSGFLWPEYEQEKAFAYLRRTLWEIHRMLGEGWLDADRGEIVRALELYSLVTRQGYLAQSRWFADLYGRFIESAAASLSLEEQGAARERGQALDFSRTIDTLLTNS